MKKAFVVMIVMLVAGCSGMGMRSSGQSSGTSGSGSGMDNTYRPNLSPPFNRMDSSFDPYFGG